MLFSLYEHPYGQVIKRCLINFVVSDIPKVTATIKEKFTDATSIDELDGVSVWYKDWWFNVRASKTEPLLRLNLEADNSRLLQEKTDFLISFLRDLGATRKD